MYQDAGNTFRKKVQTAIEEVGKELQLIAKLGGLKFNLDKQDTDDERNFLRIGGGILAVAGALMAFIPPLAAIGLVIGIVGSAISFIGGFFKSKDQKRREAVQSISSSLRKQINNQQQTTLSEAVKQFHVACEDVTANVDTYLKQLIEGLEGIAKQLESAQSRLEEKANVLNYAYAKRIIDWCLKRYEPLTREGIKNDIAEVNRDFGRSMSIKTRSFLQLQRTQDEINGVLQENISIQLSTLPAPAPEKSPNIESPTSPTPQAARHPKRKFPGVVGIDLGTTNSAVAVMKNGQPVAIANKEGFLTTSSVVAYTHRGVCLVGETAKHQAITNPENTFDSVMRFIGCKYDEVTKEAKQLPYRILRDAEGRVKIDCPVLGQQFTPEEILAQVLRKLVDDASQRLDGQVTQIVITVPAYFNVIQHNTIKDAGRIAGLEVLRVISHPTAAALAYRFNKKDNKIILVFDLGAGHFSVSILEAGDGVFEVLAYSGDTQLGGNDFDQKIMDWLAQEFTLEGIDLYQNSQALQRLRKAVEKAKIELSTTTQTEINLPWLTTTVFGPKHLKTTLTRYKFEQLCANLINRCRSIVDNALQNAKLDKSSINEVILVGGSTRIPAVQNVLQQFFGKEPKQGFNFDEAVALGAAVEAGVLSGDTTGILLLDAIPLSLGFESLYGTMTKVILRNTTFPTKKSEIFSTAVDGQTYVEFHILQGEGEMVGDNKSLGVLRLEGIQPAPRGVPQIEVTFAIDANNILNVTAKDKGTGKEQSIIISLSNLSKEEVKRYTLQLDKNIDS